MDIEVADRNKVGGGSMLVLNRGVVRDQSAVRQNG